MTKKIGEFNTEACVDCTVSKLCHGGRLVNAAMNGYADAAFKEKDQDSPSFTGLLLDVVSLDDFVTANKKAVQRAKAQYDKSRSALSHLMTSVVDARVKCWDSQFIYPSGVTASTQVAAERFGFEMDVDAPIIEELVRVGQDIVNYVNDGVCGAIEIPES